MRDIRRLLNRAAFGPRPRDVERVQKTGTEKYLDQQLHPYRIDDSATQARLTSTPSISMTITEVIGQMANQLKNFGGGLTAFYRNLGDRMRNIMIVTMTESGRAIRQNGSGGTDHGHASCIFLAGGPVKGGKVYGQWPGLAPEQLYEGRDVLAEILVKHMGAKDVKKVFPEFKPGEMGSYTYYPIF